MAVTHGQLGGFISIPVIRNDTDCPNDEKNCYQTEEPLENVKCNGFGKISAQNPCLYQFQIMIYVPQTEQHPE